MTISAPVEPILEHPDLGAVRLLDARELRHDSLGEHVDDVAVRVVLLEQAAQVGATRADDARREQSAPHGQAGAERT